MPVLCALLLLMMVAMMCLNVVPFMTYKAIRTNSFIVFTLLTLLTTMRLHWLSGDKRELNQWLTKGKSHCQRLATANQLGGINGMISRIHPELKANPNDAQGWLILGKLYLAEQNVQAAEVAIQKAHE